MILPLEASRGLKQPKIVILGPKCWFSGHPRSDIIVKCGLYGHISPSTTSAEVLRAIWTRFDLLTPSRSRVRSKKPTKSPFLAYNQAWPIKRIQMNASDKPGWRSLRAKPSSGCRKLPIWHLHSQSEVKKVKNPCLQLSQSKNWSKFRHPSKKTS